GRRPGGERALDESVLEGLVGQDDDPATDGEGVDRGRDGALQRSELLVHFDSQGLEDALGRVALALDRYRRRRRDDVNKVTGAQERLLGASLHDLLRVSRREPLLAVFTEDGAQFFLAVLRDDAFRRHRG